MDHLTQLTQQQIHGLYSALYFIEHHLNEPLTLDIIANQSPWSRWQLQRLIVAATGFTLAQYVRELRLAMAAKQLLANKDRQLDIALRCGFESEISFSRSFKQHFGCSPGKYRKSNLLTKIRVPLTQSNLIPIRIEHKPSFIMQGNACPIKGLASTAPDFRTVIPSLRQDTLQQFPHWENQNLPLIGAFLKEQNKEGEFKYWAGIEGESQHKDQSHDQSDNQLSLPSQTYAVVTHRQQFDFFESTVSWFIDHWLPSSPLSYQQGIDLELYPQGTSSIKEASAEYWVPITVR